jgi:hypothetical protein
VGEHRSEGPRPGKLFHFEKVVAQRRNHQTPKGDIDFVVMKTPKLGTFKKERPPDRGPFENLEQTANEKSFPL